MALSTWIGVPLFRACRLRLKKGYVLLAIQLAEALIDSSDVLEQYKGFFFWASKMEHQPRGLTPRYLLHVTTIRIMAYQESLKTTTTRITLSTVL